MKNLKNHLLLITSVTLLFFHSCSKDNGPVTGSPGTPIITEAGEPSGQADEATIGPGGGIISSSDGLLSVNIPQGALASSTVISIQPITNQAPLGLGKGYRLEPDGLTFEKPVTLTFNYTEELLDYNLAEFLWIVFQEDDGSWNAMLESVVNTNSKTVTVESSHFSDWSLGTFLDISLDPVETIIEKGDKVALSLAGFSKGYVEKNGKNANDLLAPLVLAPKDEIEKLQFLATNYAFFRVVGWTLNAVKAPVSNNFGSLATSSSGATYTAPSNVPTPNVVAVTVELEGKNEQGEIGTFFLTSNITILKDPYLEVIFRGKTYTYYQYGANQLEIPDQNHFSMASCGLDDNELTIGGATFFNSALTDAFEIIFENPGSHGTRSLIGEWDGGNDRMDFTILNPDASYDLLNVTRTKVGGNNCNAVYNESNNASLTLTYYKGTSQSVVTGHFFGTLYYSDTSYETDCKSSTPYPVTGSFQLVLLTPPK